MYDVVGGVRGIPGGEIVCCAANGGVEGTEAPLHLAGGTGPEVLFPFSSEVVLAVFFDHTDCLGRNPECDGLFGFAGIGVSEGL